MESSQDKANTVPPRLPDAESHARRRAKYSVNVLIAVLAAVGLVILINWIGARQYVRWDLTATRRYSLSPQTLKVLDSLQDDYRIITLLPPPAAVRPPLDDIIQQAIDLTDEYDRRSSHIQVEHFDPGVDASRLESFYASIIKRFQDDLENIRKAVDQGRQALAQLRSEAVKLQAPLHELYEATPRDNELSRFVQQVVQAFARVGPMLDDVDTAIERQLSGPLPNYEAARTSMTSTLENLGDGVFQPCITEFQKKAADESVPAAAKEIMLKLTPSFEGVHTQINDAKQELEKIDQVEAYNNIRTRLATPESVIIVGPSDIQVIGRDDLFRQPDQRQMQPGQAVQLSFQGEEKLTGALVSMSLENPPLVVFVNSGQQPAMGYSGAYQQVAQRLQNVNFDVQEWNPTMRMGPGQQPMPPGPMPEPEPGQNAVWIVLPSPPPDPRNPMAQQAGGQVATAMQERLDAGNAVMFMLSFNPMSFMGGGDQTGKLFEPFGITAQMDRAIVSEVRLPDHRLTVHAMYDIVRWPDASPITRALAGIPGHFELPSPLVLSGSDNDELEVIPLVSIKKKRTWAETNLQSTAPEFDAATAKDEFIVAAAADRAGTRVAVFTCSHGTGTQLRNWAADRTINTGPFGEGTAEMFGAVWPANAELFVNTVCWLSGLENLIAASARTQDIQRVDNLTPGGLTRLRWFVMAGFPTVCVAIGLGVWWSRRSP